MDGRNTNRSNSDSRRRRRLRRERQKKLRRQRMAVLASAALLAVCFVGVLIKVLFFSESSVRSADQRAEGQGAAGRQTVSEDGAQDHGEQSSASIILKDDAPLQIKLGDAFTEPGYTAADEDGTDLTSSVQVDLSGLNRAGEQQVVYTVQGNNGVTAEAVRQVEVLPNTEYETPGLPICMYHYVYDPAEPPESPDSNFISTTALAEEMQYLHDSGYYFPTWQEVRDYVDGKLILPEKSIVLTFDDGPNYMYLGTPVLEQYQTPATSFVIASYWDSKEMLYGYASDYLTFQSHSYRMHQGGGNIGHGGIYTAMSREEVISDLQTSFEICGNSDAFAYPFGDYTEEGCAALEEAGLLCAVTTENSKCYPGDNPYLLPRVRMIGSQTLAEFIAAIDGA